MSKLLPLSAEVKREALRLIDRGLAGTAPSAPGPQPLLPARLRIVLWGIRSLADSLEVELNQARVEATGPNGEPLDQEAYDAIESATYAIFFLSSFIERRVGRWGLTE